MTIQVLSVKISRIKKKGSGYPRPFAVVKDKEQLEQLRKDVVNILEIQFKNSNIEERYMILFETQEK